VVLWTRPGMFDSCSRFRSNSIRNLHLPSPLGRICTMMAGIWLFGSAFWLLVVSALPARAASGPAAPTSGRACVTQAIFGVLSGPRDLRFGLAPGGGLTDSSALIQRAAPDGDDDEQAMIQDESPAARIDAGDRVAPPL